MSTTFTTAPALNITSSSTGFAKRILDWVIAKDQAYKAQCHLETLDEAALKDIGLRS